MFCEGLYRLLYRPSSRRAATVTAGSTWCGCLYLNKQFLCSYGHLCQSPQPSRHAARRVATARVAVNQYPPSWLTCSNGTAVDRSNTIYLGKNNISDLFASNPLASSFIAIRKQLIVKIRLFDICQTMTVGYCDEINTLSVQRVAQ